ncbi:MAG TPA: signal peptidase I [Stellaceae bacterium]|nr:signal peptidase I [Stellaceae bacterium]
MARTASKTTSGLVELVKTLVYAIVIALFIRSFFYEPFSIPSASMVPTLLVGDYLFVSKFSYGYSRYSLPYGYLSPPLTGGSGRVFYRAPRRGDVVVFKLPCDYSRLEKSNPSEADYLMQSCSRSTDFIKRIIGTPGDRIQMKKGVLYINDAPVQEKPKGNGYYYPDCMRAGFYPEFEETLTGEVKTGDRVEPFQMTHNILKNCRPPQLDDTPEFAVPANSYFMMGDNRDDSADSRDPTSGVGFVPAENLVGPAQFIFFSTNASLWEPWNWLFGIRFERLFMGIH